MGSAISSIFGGGAPSVSEPQINPAPNREAEKEPVAKSTRDAERRKLASRNSLSGTILTSPLGTSGQSSILGKLGG